MNIEEVRLKLVQQALELKIPLDQISSKVEPLAKYVIYGLNDHKTTAEAEEADKDCFRYDGDMQDKDGNFYVPHWAQEALNSGEFCFLDQGHLHIKTEHGYTRIAAGSIIKKRPDGGYQPRKDRPPHFKCQPPKKP